MFNYNKDTGIIKNNEDNNYISTLEFDNDGIDMNASEVIISKDGKYIYVSNRDISKPNKNRNTIGVFEIKEMQNTFSISKI